MLHTSQDGRTPLMTASRGGHIGIVRLLIEAKAHINTRDKVWMAATTTREHTT